MANTFAAALESALKVGEEVTSFVGNLRALGASFLEEGDVFRIPVDFKVFKNNELTKDPEKPVCFTVAEIFDAQGNVTGGKQVYPGSLNRTVYHYHKTEDGEVLNMHKTFVPEGQPVIDFNSEKETQNAMKKIAGRKIRVVKVTPVETRDFNDKTKTTTQSVYTFAYAD